MCKEHAVAALREEHSPSGRAVDIIVRTKDALFADHIEQRKKPHIAINQID